MSAHYLPRRLPESLHRDIRGLPHHFTRWAGSRADAPPIVLLHGFMDCGATYQFVADEHRADADADRARLARLRPVRLESAGLLVSRLLRRPRRHARLAGARHAGRYRRPQHGWQRRDDLRGAAARARASAGDARRLRSARRAPGTRARPLPRLARPVARAGARVGVSGSRRVRGRAAQAQSAADGRACRFRRAGVERDAARRPRRVRHSIRRTSVSIPSCTGARRSRRAGPRSVHRCCTSRAQSRISSNDCRAPAIRRKCAAWCRSSSRGSSTAAGHMVHHDQPAAVARLLEEFLDR